MSLDAARLALIAGAACILVALEFGGRALLRDGKIELGPRVYWTGWAVGILLFLIATWGGLGKTMRWASHICSPRIYGSVVVFTRWVSPVAATPSRPR